MAFAPYVIAAIAAASAYKQSETAANAADYNAQIAQQNQTLAAAQDSRQAEILSGQQRAAYGASGVQGSTGSPLDVLADTATQSALDRAKIKYNYGSQINLDNAQASNYRSSALIGAAAAGGTAYATAIPLWGKLAGTPIGGGAAIGGVNNSAGTVAMDNLA
jgi:hypothetical protein